MANDYGVVLLLLILLFLFFFFSDDHVCITLYIFLFC